MRYIDENGRKSSGITIAERANLDIYDLILERDSIDRLPNGPAKTAARERWAALRNGVLLRATRVYIGRDATQVAVLNLFDRNGKPRLRLRVDSEALPPASSPLSPHSSRNASTGSTRAARRAGRKAATVALIATSPIPIPIVTGS